MTRVDESGWVREYDRVPTRRELEATRNLDIAEVTASWALSGFATDPSYGSDPCHVVAPAIPSAQPDVVIEDKTAPIFIGADDTTFPGEGVDVDTSDFDEVA